MALQQHSTHSSPGYNTPEETRRGVVPEEIKKSLLIPDTSLRGYCRDFYRSITSPLRLTPGFIIIGVERGGTTSLYQYLSEYPLVGGATRKEVHFFDYRYQRGLAWYRGQFPYLLEKYRPEEGRKHFTTGEASPNYILYPHTAERIAKHLPGVKLILLLRNPIDRAYSHYSLKKQQQREPLTFEEALQQEDARTQDEWKKQVIYSRYVSYPYWYYNYNYRARGIYADQIQPWLRLFPKEQLLIIKSEDFYAEPEKTFNQTLSFLNVPEVKHTIEFKALHGYTHTLSKIKAETHQYLKDFYAPHNERLYTLLGRDFGWE